MLYNFIGLRAETLWKPLLFYDFYIIWHSESGKLEQINQINQSKSMSWFYTFFLFVIAGPFCHILGGNMQFFAVSARIQWLNPCAIDYFQKLIISHKYVTFELLLNIQRYIRWWKQYKCYFWGLISGGNIKKSQVSARNIFDSYLWNSYYMNDSYI